MGVLHKEDFLAARLRCGTIGKYEVSLSPLHSTHVLQKFNFGSRYIGMPLWKTKYSQSYRGRKEG